MDPKLLIFALFFSSSNLFSALSPKCQKYFNGKKHVETKLTYAKTFSIKSFKDFKLFEVKKPWKSSRNSIYYIVSSQKIEISKTCPEIRVIKTPIKRVISLSTTHIPWFDMLNLSQRLKGFSNTKFISNEKILNLVRKGKIKEVGAPPKVEIALSLTPDIILAYATDFPAIEGINKLERLNLPVIYVTEFREQSPLARFEWIKFVAALFDLEKKGDEKFNVVVSRYTELKTKVAKMGYRPLVAIGENRGGIWYAPGGQSDLVKLLEEAGAKYIWDRFKTRSQVTLQFEVALRDLESANFWFPQNSWKTQQDVLKEDRRYGSLKVFAKKLVYNNNRLISSGGGNDYWERAMMRPDLLLTDLVKIFHPQIVSSHKLIWYKKLQGMK